jgi:hypothetical protein
MGGVGYGRIVTVRINRDGQTQCHDAGSSARIAARRKSLHVSIIVCGTGGGGYLQSGMA